MKSALFNVLVFGGVTVLAAVYSPWAAIGFAVITAARVIMLLVAAGRIREGQLGAALLANYGLMYVGFAYLVSLLAGTPQTGGFWLIFVAFLLPFAPAMAFARKVFLAKPSGKT